VVSNDFPVHKGEQDISGCRPPRVFAGEPDEAVPDLVNAIGDKPHQADGRLRQAEIRRLSKRQDSGQRLVARSRNQSRGSRRFTLANLAVMGGADMAVRHPLDYVGSEGGGGPSWRTRAMRSDNRTRSQGLRKVPVAV